MLQLQPNCELCDKDLPPESTEAMICTYECTFCSDCVESKLQNVCPNCGGGFEKRPVRPVNDRRSGVSRLHQLPSNKRIHTKYSEREIHNFAENAKHIPPEER